MARRPMGPEQVERLEGSAEAKERLRVILETVAGTKSIEDACAELDVGPARFAELRDEALGAALAGLEPKPAGRPPRAPDPAAEELQALRDEKNRLDLELHAAWIREEIALLMPHLLKPRDAGVKKTPHGPKDRAGRKNATSKG